MPDERTSDTQNWASVHRIPPHYFWRQFDKLWLLFVNWMPVAKFWSYPMDAQLIFRMPLFLFKYKYIYIALLRRSITITINENSITWNNTHRQCSPQENHNNQTFFHFVMEITTKNKEKYFIFTIFAFSLFQFSI